MNISDYKDHFYLHLIESAPFNMGRPKLYEGVPGNLFAFTCKVSQEKGYEGFVAFTSKTRLISHYEKMLEAVHIGNHKWLYFPRLQTNSLIDILNFKYMGYIKEPKGIDFEVDPTPLTEEDKRMISETIAYYKATGKKKRTVVRKRTVRTAKTGKNSRK